MVGMVLQGEQLRAARALLRWSQSKLAAQASSISPVSAETIGRWEAINGTINAQSAAIDAVVRTLEVAGVELLNHGAPGARLRRMEEGAAL